MDYLKSASFEHTFWLQVLADHAEIIDDALHSQEERDMADAKEYITVFRNLLTEVEYLSDSNVIAFTKKAETATENLKKWKLSLLERQLHASVRIQLAPTTINHMVNELEEFMRITNYLKEGKPAPYYHVLHHHLLWLKTATGHASSLQTCFDNTERKLLEKYRIFETSFTNQYLRAVELTGFLRADITRFPALEKFNQDVLDTVTEYHSFLQMIKKEDRANTILTTCSPLLLDHMYREITYFKSKVQSSMIL